jgi:hypothetical protein
VTIGFFRILWYHAGLAGKAADGTLLAEPAPPEYLRAALAAIKEGRAAPSARAQHTLSTYNCLALDEDPEPEEEAVTAAGRIAARLRQDS